MYDVVIIGAGPAGISAGIYAVSRGKKVLIVEKNIVGGLIGKVSTVTHYAGIMSEETGVTFANRLKEQAESAGIEIAYGEVKRVELTGEVKKIYTEDKDKWHGIQAGPCGTQILNQLAADFQGIMSGETSVDEGLKEAEDYANGLLDEYWANK